MNIKQVILDGLKKKLIRDGIKVDKVLDWNEHYYYETCGEGTCDYSYTIVEVTYTEKGSTQRYRKVYETKFADLINDLSLDL